MKWDARTIKFVKSTFRHGDWSLGESFRRTVSTAQLQHTSPVRITPWYKTTPNNSRIRVSWRLRRPNWPSYGQHHRLAKTTTHNPRPSEDKAAADASISLHRPKRKVQCIWTSAFQPHQIVPNELSKEENLHFLITLLRNDAIEFWQFLNSEPDSSLKDVLAKFRKEHACEIFCIKWHQLKHDHQTESLNNFLKKIKNSWKHAS